MLEFESAAASWIWGRTYFISRTMLQWSLFWSFLQSFDPSQVPVITHLLFVHLSSLFCHFLGKFWIFLLYVSGDGAF